MEKKDTFTKVLAIVGAVLVWIPLLAPVLFSAIRLIQVGDFLFDYLMPAEMFPLALVGSGLLLWAAFRARSRRGLIGWGLVVAVAFLVGGQAFAVATGLASGAREATGWLFAVAIGAILIFVLALVVVGIGGILLTSDLFKEVRGGTPIEIVEAGPKV